MGSGSGGGVSAYGLGLKEGDSIWATIGKPLSMLVPYFTVSLLLGEGGYRESLFSTGCPGTHCVDQVGLELAVILLPLLSGCWDPRHSIMSGPPEGSFCCPTL